MSNAFTSNFTSLNAASFTTMFTCEKSFCWPICVHFCAVPTCWLVDSITHVCARGCACPHACARYKQNRDPHTRIEVKTPQGTLWLPLFQVTFFTGYWWWLFITKSDTLLYQKPILCGSNPEPLEAWRQQYQLEFMSVRMESNGDKFLQRGKKVSKHS